MQIGVICDGDYTQGDIALAMQNPRNPQFDKLDDDERLELLLVAAACVSEKLNPLDDKDFDTALFLVRKNMSCVIDSEFHFSLINDYISYTIDNIEKNSGFWPDN